MACARASAGQPKTAAASPLRRPLDRALIGGVCAGLSERIGVEVLVVRVLAVMAATVGGLGVAAYALAWALIPASPGSARSRRPGAWRQAPLIVLTVAALFAGVHLAGSHVGEGLWPLVLGACGMALLWRPAVAVDDSLPKRRSTLRDYLNRPAQVGAPRLIAGGLFVAFGAAALLHAVGVQHSLGKAIWAVAIIGL